MKNYVFLFVTGSCPDHCNRGNTIGFQSNLCVWSTDTAKQARGHAGSGQTLLLLSWLVK